MNEFLTVLLDLNDDSEGDQFISMGKFFYNLFIIFFLFLPFFLYLFFYFFSASIPSTSIQEQGPVSSSKPTPSYEKVLEEISLSSDDDDINYDVYIEEEDDDNEPKGKITHNFLTNTSLINSYISESIFLIVCVFL